MNSTMRSRHLWLILVVALGVLLGIWWKRSMDSRVPAKKVSVGIEDQKTIDFSSGKPVVKDAAGDKAIIDKAVKEMDAATKDITFAPTAPAKSENPAPGAGKPKK